MEVLMTKLIWPDLHDRMVRLAETFRQLKERVRDAVASEMGRVVADAVRDLINTVLRPRPSHPEHVEPQPVERDEYPNDWNDDQEYEARDSYQEPPRVIPSEPENLAPPTVSKWAAALSVGVAVTRWLIYRRLPILPTIGIGMAVGAVALVSKPVFQASLSAASAAVELVNMTQTTH
jgi:hypothetical protein